MKFVIIILLLISTLCFTKAQENDTTYKYWLTMGFMFYERDTSLNLSYNFSWAENFFKVGYMVKRWNDGRISE